MAARRQYRETGSSRSNFRSARRYRDLSLPRMKM